MSYTRKFVHKHFKATIPGHAHVNNVLSQFFKGMILTPTHPSHSANVLAYASETAAPTIELMAIMACTSNLNVQLLDAYNFTQVLIFAFSALDCTPVAIQISCIMLNFPFLWDNANVFLITGVLNPYIYGCKTVRHACM